MAAQQADSEHEWHQRLDAFLAPFLSRFRRAAQRKWAPVYLGGLLAGTDRKTMQRVAATVAPTEVQQIHHFVSTSPWDVGPLEEELAFCAHQLVGGEDAHLIVDDTAIVKKGKLSVGVAHQYCGELGKTANCQSLVSLTLARDEVPVAIGLRLFLPKSWAQNRERCRRAGVPDEIDYRPKWQIALDEVDRLLRANIQFGDVLADCEYGRCSEFRAALSERGLRWAVGVMSDQQVYPVDVELVMPHRKTGRPRKHPEPTEKAVSAQQYIEQLGPKAFRRVAWRYGTKGTLSGVFAAVRVCVADGERARFGFRLPGEKAWLIAERRTNETRYYLSNHPASASLRMLAGAIKARWSCEQAHQHLKQEIGLDHFEGRSWNGLHHHSLLAMIAMAFLQTLRLNEEKKRPASRTASVAVAASNTAPHQRRASRFAT
jgi:SRSO17 transposase